MKRGGAQRLKPSKTGEGIVLTRDLCATILGEDARQRRAMAWPLLGWENVCALQASVTPSQGPIMVAPDLLVVEPLRPDRGKNSTQRAEHVAARLHVRPLFEFVELHRRENKHDCELVVAGGAVCGVLASRHWQDVDIFFVSPSKNVAAAEELLRALVSTFDDENGGTLFVRNSFTVTAISGGNSTFQFVLRLYPSVASVLGGFDLGASQMGLVYDAGKISLVFTHLGAWSYALGANIVDVTRRSPTYEQRLEKYHLRKGFGIVLPGVDVGKLGSDALLGTVATLRRAGNGYTFRAVHKWGECLEYDCDELGHHLMDVVNFQHALHGRPEHVRVSAFTSQELFDAPKVRTNLVDRHVRRFERKESSSLVLNGQSLYAQCLGSRAVEFLEAQLVGDAAAMERVVEETADRVSAALCVAAERLRTIKFITENPGSQLWTSSLAPLMENPREFYTAQLYARVCVGIGNSVWYRMCLLRHFCPMVRAVPKDVLKIIGRLVDQLEYNDMFAQLLKSKPAN